MRKDIFESKKPFALNHHCYIQVSRPLVEGFVPPLSSTHGLPQCYYPFQVAMVKQGNRLVSHLSLCNKSDFNKYNVLRSSVHFPSKRLFHENEVHWRTWLNPETYSRYVPCHFQQLFLTSTFVVTLPKEKQT